MWELDRVLAALLCMIHICRSAAHENSGSPQFLPTDYRLAHIILVNSEGRFISHWTSDSHRLHLADRHRRSVELDNHLYLNITSGNETFHLKLYPNSHLLAPGFKVYLRHGSNVTSSMETESSLHTDDCMYRGDVTSHSSTAAVALCRGVTGVLQLPDEDYVIEPMAEHLYIKNTSTSPHHRHGHHHHHGYGQPHVLYKKSALQGHEPIYYEAQKHDQYLKPTRTKRSSDSKNLQENLSHDQQQQESLSHDQRHQERLSRERQRQERLLHHDRQHRERLLYDRRRQEMLLRARRQQERSRAANARRQQDSLSNTKRQQGSSSSDRRRQEFSRTKTVETLVVVDQHVYVKHGRQNVTTYVLSMFNMVSQLFLDDSLGYKVNIVLVGLIIMDGSEPGLTISHNADKTLNSFCQWQAVIGGKRHRQHDHAILLTGLDICALRNAPCNTLGFAPVKGMCNRLRSCSVTEDSGLATAFTIAHEIGHNFGMLHDGTDNMCRPHTGTIMSPTLSSKSGIFKWSQCSRNYLHRFFNTIQSSCLVDEPQAVAELKFPDKLPGEIFNADTQCQWQFGKHASLCIFDFGKREICQKLWCYKGGMMCETKFLPAADGTSCGAGKWCRQGKCETYGVQGPLPVNGQWSAWSEWSACSRTCGGGVKSRKRQCNDPLPQYGGEPCKGNDSMSKLCNLQSCGENSADFRGVQCKGYDDKAFRGWHYKWKPYKRIFDVQDQCKLYCQANGYNFFYALAKQVVDGTRCNDYSNDICVQGQCRSVGCDLVIGSPAKKDICGVCMGDNSTCNVFEGIYESQPERNRYFPIVVIPKGARSIVLRETSLSTNYLALRNIFGKYYLNGDWHLSTEGSYMVGGARFIYKRSYREPERLESGGPLSEDIVLELLSQGVNPGISYQYAMPKVLPTVFAVPHNHTWSVKLTHCSELCAGGVQTSTAHCYREDGEEVNPRLCDPKSRPHTGVSSCNVKPCTPRWFTEPWGDCTKSCGGGKQKRRVFCRQKISQKEDRRVSKRRCDKNIRPAKKIACNTQECPPAWHMKKWSECSTTCGPGTKTREVTCRSRTSRGPIDLPTTMCQHQPAVATTRKCQVTKCPPIITYQWIVSSWAECSTTCGSGVRTRQLKCGKQKNGRGWKMESTAKCRDVIPPDIPLKEECQLLACPVEEHPFWFSSPWSQCSVTCGAGIQTRLVHCMDKQTQGLASGCPASTKPLSRRRCQTTTCPTPDPLCIDQFQWCHLVPKHDICNHHFYGRKCCLSCKAKS
ncbi:A disintegrin and metalloproteinase with thrombospondin motifs 18-like [Mizuhopecten yessoensis]|uniref:A disintegrin and metalloproteinase with thrombospondin motifs 18 n=2 Tax=Mizuhopecten yessoensis TaxID=6573 RepID=A0A210R5S7_MIZYE|nr:A disintegrin and metalloproteinase with thrombospondin motifs 18-like [Mizuhopecten yessoensis]OWF56393.1 A disintegrin and metalloproteinase with thrombospondin motifs 18 [Mizuhopecten yessoensis]